MEMLVGIGVIATLVVLLTSAAQPVLHKSKQAKSSGNLRGLSQACLQYASENNQMLPPYQNLSGYFWFQYLIPDYMSGDYRVLISPTDNLMSSISPGSKRPTFTNLLTGKPTVVYSYAMNVALPLAANPVPLPDGWGTANTYSQPKSMLRLTDLRSTALLLETGIVGGLSEDHSALQTNYFRFSSRDQEKMLVAFCDGSVREIDKDVILREGANTPEKLREHRQFWFSNPEAVKPWRY